MIEQFREAIRSAGLQPPDTIEADGKLHRFPSNGKRGDDAGWYVLHGDCIPAGRFGNWRAGVSESWRADIGRTLTPTEEAAHRAKVEAIRREREPKEVRPKAEAAAKAAAIWAKRRDERSGSDFDESTFFAKSSTKENRSGGKMNTKFRYKGPLRKIDSEYSGPPWVFVIVAFGLGLVLWRAIW